MKTHIYYTKLEWSGNKGLGTQSYKVYDRSFEVGADGKPAISGSSDPSFSGDPTKHNPEEMLLMALSSCHMLWFLHLCAVNKIIVEEYYDNASGIMNENPDGSGEFVEVTLKPSVVVSSGDTSLAEHLHDRANKLCFISRSVNFLVKQQATIRLG
ncbi:MAG: OsmC family protein [Bacteroidetes bacterium]|nr:OsmC family protein [Bacteroidota bacterium]MDA1121932.1 OsmC family protein [Bacteroidota bacterium]